MKCSGDRVGGSQRSRRYCIRIGQVVAVVVAPQVAVPDLASRKNTQMTLVAPTSPQSMSSTNVLFARATVWYVDRSMDRFDRAVPALRAQAVAMP